MQIIMKRCFLAGISLCLYSAIASGDDTFGWIEKATIESWDIEVKTKLDSGALTSSMHAEDIERFKRDDEEWVRFTIDLEDEDSGEKITERIERPLLRDLAVRGAGGKDVRPVVLMKICMGETIYEEQFSLRDRAGMLYPVLLGRRTIQHLGEVDVTRTFLQDPACDADSPVLSYAEQESNEDIGID